MEIENIPKEELMKPAEGLFAMTIIYIENISEPGIYWDEKFLLLSMYNRGMKDGVDLFNEVINRIENIKDYPSSIYILGVQESISMINEMIYKIDRMLKEYETNIEKLRISLTELYMRGITDVGELYRQRMLNKDIDIANIIKDIDSISTTYKEEPEETWEMIRNRLEMSVES